MKKLFGLGIVGISALSLSSCNEEFSCGGEGDELTVGMDLSYPPFETKNINNDNPEGISVDIACELGEELDRKVVIKDLEFSTIITALEQNSIDIAIASMSITEERKEKVDFTDPYFDFKIVQLINKEFATANNITEDTPVSELFNIEGVRYAGLTGQVSSSIALENDITPVMYTDKVAASNAVIQGGANGADIIMTSGSVISGWHKSNPSKTIINWNPAQNSPIGMAVKKGNNDLLTKANEFVGKFYDADSTYSMLKNKYDDEVKESLDGVMGLDFYKYEG